MRLIKDSKVTHQFLVKTLLAYHDQWNAPVAVGKMGHLVFFSSGLYGSWESRVHYRSLDRLSVHPLASRV